MIQRLSHATIWCRDQEESRKFYADKLGFEVKDDQTMGDFRWLTVGPAGTDLELVLMAIGSGLGVDAQVTEHLDQLLDAGALGTGVFETEDCRKAHEELSARGVEFIEEPTEQPYGIEAVFKDNSGNWFSLRQPLASR